jgi:hypothetical protein
MPWPSDEPAAQGLLPSACQGSAATPAALSEGSGHEPGQDLGLNIAYSDDGLTLVKPGSQQAIKHQKFITAI